MAITFTLVASSNKINMTITNIVFVEKQCLCITRKNVFILQKLFSEVLFKEN